MAHSSASKSGDTTQSPERGSRIEGKVSPAMATNVEREPEKSEEQFLASDSFYSRMEAMIKKGDVEAILEIQKETLSKFEKTNAKFGKFNDLSAARFLNLNHQLKGHTKMLIEMKKDLDSIFRRIRTLKTKLTKQYGPAFEAISAGIQKLEEELGASIGNEDACSVHTLTESSEFKSDNQLSNQKEATGEKIVQQSAEEGTCQSGISQPVPTSLLREESSEDQCTDDKSTMNSNVPVASTNAESMDRKENYLGSSSKNKTVDTERTVTKAPYSESKFFEGASSAQKFKDITAAGKVDLHDFTRQKETGDSEVTGNKDTGAMNKILNFSSRTDTPDISDTDNTLDIDPGEDFI